MRASLISAAFVAAVVGYGSTIALGLAAAAAVGADEAQTASWVLAVCLAKAIGAAILSVWHRVPVVLAWSTPGTALVAATTGLSMEMAVGAFVLTGLLIALTGLLRPLGQAVARIPDGIAGGMLAGGLLALVVEGGGGGGDPALLGLPVPAGTLAAISGIEMAVMTSVEAWWRSLVPLARYWTNCEP